MKFPILPSIIVGNTAIVIVSSMFSICFLLSLSFFVSISIVISPAISPPWNASPPSHIVSVFSGFSM